MSKALASLTAQYTDSENEEEREDESPDSQNSQASQAIIPKPHSPKPAYDEVPAAGARKKKRKKSVRRLVSYQDDTIISDEEEEEEETGSSSSDEASDRERDNAEMATNHHSNSTSKENSGGTPMEVDDEPEHVSDMKNTSKSDKLQKYAHYGFALPPEPKGKPSAELVDKIRVLYEKMDTNHMDMNRIIQERKEFRNPSIYEKLIQFCDINEFGTNYPPEMYDPLQWGAESYYEELARVQKNEMLKRQKERKDPDKIEQATALARKVEEEAKKRKSKWDQPAAVKPVVPAALTTTVTGTKGTVISAFGSLPKKPTA